VVVAFVVVVALGACSFFEEPPRARGITLSPVAPQPTPTASPTPTVSPSPSALPDVTTPSPTPTVPKPERPALMDENTQAGAEAAAIYYLELDPYLQASGDTSESDAMTLDSCEFCVGRIDQAREVAAGHYTWSSGPSTATVLHTYEQDPLTGIWPIDVEIHDEAVSVSDERGAVVFSHEAATFSRRVEMAWKDGAWIVVQVADIPGGTR
jgi:hypothetical protein